MKKYNPQAIEKKWQKKWKKDGLHRQETGERNFYVLGMFPYPSGAGLHIGHPRSYTATDIVARKRRMEGWSVLHPMGWDAFGLPAEQYAIKNKVHPEESVKTNIDTFRTQLQSLGYFYDWDREFSTTDPEYYRWTQWIFLQLFKKGLAYQSYDPINWCPTCQTGLANEDLENGRCERCGSVVEKKPMRQWVLRMTEYADRLLADLDTEKLDWPDSIKEQQRNWIGRSEGAVVDFAVEDSEEKIKVFTTRLDTIYGCTYVVVAPEHDILHKLESKISNLEEIKDYLEKVKNKTELERTDLAKEKTGVKLEGVTALNPFTKEPVPIFVADYVLGSYGTGAIMAVPAHDERDYEFAKKFDQSIIAVIRSKDVEKNSQATESAFTEDGILIDSGDYSDLESAAAREKMSEWLEKNEAGVRKVNYKMRDWVFSRQRYWGEPIPIIHCEKCGVVPVPEKDLPVELPHVDSYEPTGTGESPLANIESWINVPCPTCGGPAKRETNTMPQWAGSSWYYLRFLDPQNKAALVDLEKERKMMPVDVYVGGTEHATRHLLYARFWHKFLHDIGTVSTKEPFIKLVNQGLILANDGRKMSKRWGNVINPDVMVDEFGADAFRLYEMFMGPFGQAIAWNTDGVVGTRRFVEKVWKVAAKAAELGERENAQLESLLHRTIAKVTNDIEDFKFNTAVSALMILVNALEKEAAFSVEIMKKFLVLLAPFAPHVSEELWEMSGEKQSILLASWPIADSEKIREEASIIVVQINGKVRDRFVGEGASTEEEMREKALSLAKIQEHMAGRPVRKIIVIPGKVVNIVV